LPFSITLGSEIRKAAYATHNLFSPQQLSAVRDHAIPLRLLVAAKGLAFITVLKGGFIFAPRIGRLRVLCYICFFLLVNELVGVVLMY
jgi:lipid-binding SYLF domain-containing protein